MDHGRRGEQRGHRRNTHDDREDDLLEGRHDADVHGAGIPGVENWDNVSRDGMVTLLVANRFVVNVKGSGVDNLGVVRDFAAAIDTKPLAALATYKGP